MSTRSRRWTLGGMQTLNRDDEDGDKTAAWERGNASDVLHIAVHHRNFGI